MQFVEVGSLWLMLLALGILLVLPPHNFLAENGENTWRFHELITWILEWALLPFALGLGVSAFVYAVWFGYSTKKRPPNLRERLAS